MRKLFILVFFLMTALCYAKNIVLWHSFVGKNKILLDELIDEYNKNNMELGNNVKVEGHYLEASSLQTSFLDESKKYSGPDMLLGKHNWIGNLALQGSLTSLSESFSDRELSSFFKESVEMGEYKETLYGIPLSLNTLFVAVNKKYVKSTPNTLTDLIEIKKGLPENIELISYNYYDPYYFIPILTGFQGKLIDSSNRIFFNSSSFIDSLFFLKRLVSQNIISYSSSDAISLNDFIEEKSALLLSSSSNFPQLANSGVDYDVIPFPNFNQGNRVSVPFESNTLSVSAHSPFKEECIDFIKFLTNYSSQIKLAKSGLIPSIQIDSGYLESQNNHNSFNILVLQLERSYVIPKNPELNWIVWDELGKLISDALKPDSNIISLSYQYQNSVKNTIESEFINFKK